MNDINFSAPDQLLNIQHERADAVIRFLTHFHLLVVFQRRADKPAGKFKRLKSVVSHAALFPIEEQVIVAQRIIGFNGVQGVFDLLKETQTL